MNISCLASRGPCSRPRATPGVQTLLAEARCSAPSRPCLPAAVPVQRPSADSAHRATPKAQRRLRAVTTLGPKGQRARATFGGQLGVAFVLLGKQNSRLEGSVSLLPLRLFLRSRPGSSSTTRAPLLSNVLFFHCGCRFSPRREAPGPYGVSAQREGRARNLGGAAPSRGSFLSLGDEVRCQVWDSDTPPPQYRNSGPIAGAAGAGRGTVTWKGRMRTWAVVLLVRGNLQTLPYFPRRRRGPSSCEDTQRTCSHRRFHP